MRHEGATGAATVRVNKSGQGLLTSGEVADVRHILPSFVPLHFPLFKLMSIFVSFITSSRVSLLSNVNSVEKRKKKKDLDGAGQN